MTALYLCYQSVLEPLTRTQVVAYLEGLARDGFRIILVTFEPARLSREDAARVRGELAALGIRWRWCTYHKRPTLPATLFDVMIGVLVGWYLAVRYRVFLVHARAHVPGLMGVAISWLTGATFLFDVRGFMAEEYVDGGVWKRGGVLFRVTKAAERLLVRSADGLVLLTRRGEVWFRRWYAREIGRKPLEIIPCCMDFRLLEPADASFDASTSPRGSTVTVVYLGKLGGTYLTDEMVDFVSVMGGLARDVRWYIWTQSDPAHLRERADKNGLKGRFEVGCLPPEEVARRLGTADAGLSFVKPCLSRQASSLVKVSEYLAAGLPVVATAGIGDSDDVLVPPDGSRPTGVLIREFNPNAYRKAAEELRLLIDDPATPDRCRTAARAHYDLEKVGWDRYRRVYRQLLRGPA